MRKIISMSICLLLVLTVALSVSAHSLPRVVDDAGLLTESERAALEETAGSLYDSCGLDVVIVTVDSTYGKSVQTYADDYYDYNGYGYGSDNSGILLLLCMDSREWYISTCGEAIYIFTDYGLEQMGQAMIPYLSSGEYYEAFDCWLDMIPRYCDAFDQGSPIDGYVGPDAYYPEGGDEIVYYEPDSEPNHFVSLLIGMAAAGITVLVMRSTMNTAKKQYSAEDYVKSGSYRLNVHRDLFLYRQVTKTPKADNSSGGGRSGGGSSVHRSSSGASHGGRGGRF